ncbi:MAG: NUDIX hydrolase [Oscillospiraceae bacterium]|nr:NUDIX hydrolase [Oscillospiraceae bacterium]
MDRIAEWAAELQSLAQAGLYYTRDVFDRERFQRIREIAAEMMAAGTGLPLKKVAELFCADFGYQTPKVDTRAAIFQEGKILLVQEKNGRWSLPGGWCEFNLSPAENAVKEAREEAGVEVAVKSLIAVQDRDRHNSPPYPFHIVKIFYMCQLLGGAFTENSETLACAYFARDELPPMAVERCSADQVLMCFDAAEAADWKPLFE